MTGFPSVFSHVRKSHGPQPGNCKIPETGNCGSVQNSRGSVRSPVFGEFLDRTLKLYEKHVMAAA